MSAPDVLYTLSRRQAARPWQIARVSLDIRAQMAVPARSVLRASSRAPQAAPHAPHVPGTRFLPLVRAPVPSALLELKHPRARRCAAQTPTRRDLMVAQTAFATQDIRHSIPRQAALPAPRAVRESSRAFQAVKLAACAPATRIPPPLARKRRALVPPAQLAQTHPKAGVSAVKTPTRKALLMAAPTACAMLGSLERVVALAWLAQRAASSPRWARRHARSVAVASIQRRRLRPIPACVLTVLSMRRLLLEVHPALAREAILLAQLELVWPVR